MIDGSEIDIRTRKNSRVPVIVCEVCGCIVLADRADDHQRSHDGTGQ